jgi:serine/threonine protein kinase
MSVENFEIKVCDIGCGIEIGNNYEQTHTIQGTVPFLAPELIENYSKMKSHANPFKSDIFSLGLCLVYVICFKKINARDRS